MASGGLRVWGLFSSSSVYVGELPSVRLLLGAGCSFLPLVFPWLTYTCRTLVLGLGSACYRYLFLLARWRLFLLWLAFVLGHSGVSVWFRPLLCIVCKSVIVCCDYLIQFLG